MPSDHASPASADIAEVQRLLSVVGVRVPHATGEWNDDTRLALETYLSERGVGKGEVAAAITPDLLERLRDEVAALQIELKVRGDYAGPINGRADDDSLMALRGFMGDRGSGAHLPRIDASARRKLEHDSRAQFDDVLRIELEEIQRARPASLKRQGCGTCGNARERAHDAQLVGLAFSGGGIRSATFNLGLLQALSELKLLHVFDYLSTVSGGGYIGSWLSAFIKRRADGDPARAAEEIRPGSRAGSTASESPAIRFLRSYSNYLTPRLGALSLDTLAAVATYLRNLYLNLVTLVLFLAALLMVPRIFVLLLPGVELGRALDFGELRFLSLSGLALLLVSTPIVGANLAYRRPLEDAPIPWFAQKPWISILFWAPVILGAYLLGYWFTAAEYLRTLLWLEWMVWGAGIYLLAAAIGVLGYWYVKTHYPADRPLEEYPDKFGPLPLLVWALIAGAAGGLIMLGFTHLLDVLTPRDDPRMGKWFGAGLGAIVIVQAVSLIVALHVGLMGRRYTEQAREWWSRLGGTAISHALAWITVFVVGIYAPPLVALAGSWSSWGALGTWVASTLAGVLLGSSQATGREIPTRRILEIVARISPYIFIVGMLVAVSLLLSWSLAELVNARDACSDARGGRDTVLAFEFCIMGKNSIPQLLLIAAALLGLGLLLSWRVDINLFSIYNFYRNRLARCYLGATRVEKRKPQPFTGFDPHDDLPMHSLRRDAGDQGYVWQRPYHIVNTALNLVQGEALEWQQRKAAPFSFTPHFTGFELPPTVEAAAAPSRPAVEAAPPGKPVAESTRSAANDRPSRGGYRPTARSWRHGGVPLGSALAISGAAASPNMGYHSAPALAFLMTVFNVRLGRWCGNPADEEAWKWRSPTIAVRYLFYELLGLTNSRTPFVYLSDGGHFENLGIYELVRRRCRFILASDAAQDAHLKFEDLGNAIRKCQADFGIPIDIDVRPIRLVGDTKRSEWHCAVGTIHYEAVDPHAVPGVLLYLKPSLVGNEPTDILQYAAAEPTFPHQSTGDQWFDESQFESYRKLGYYIGLTVLAKAKEMAEAEHGIQEKRALFSDVEGLIVALKAIWQPPAKGGAEAFTRHAATLDAIYERLRADPKLRFLDAQIYPNWGAIMQGVRYDVPLGQWLPATYAELREGFYLCNSVIQLMENVYHDLALETQFDHPDNRGWMNLFRHWAWCNMFRVTWGMSAATYGARFQSFCKRQLGLALGKVEVRPQDFEEARAGSALNFLEKDLVTQLLLQHPDLHGRTLQLSLVEVVVRNPQNEPDSIRMSVGFALAADAESGAELVFFRIQDHLRRMGLARAAVCVLMKEHDVKGIRILELSPPAPESIGEAEQRRFERLFRSVQYELDKSEEG